MRALAAPPRGDVTCNAKAASPAHLSSTPRTVTECAVVMTLVVVEDDGTILGTLGRSRSGVGPRAPNASTVPGRNPPVAMLSETSAATSEVPAAIGLPRPSSSVKATVVCGTGAPDGQNGGNCTKYDEPVPVVSDCSWFRLDSGITAVGSPPDDARLK